MVSGKHSEDAEDKCTAGKKEGCPSLSFKKKDRKRTGEYELSCSHFQQGKGDSV